MTSTRPNTELRLPTSTAFSGPELNVAVSRS